MKVALLIIYNHRYDKNIPIIEKLYRGKFQHIYHLMPFYDGDKSNVIPVYESSFYFGSYISQAYTHLKKLGFTHFFIVADDMVINPAITENNLLEFLGIESDDCFIPNLQELQSDHHQWGHLDNALEYTPRKSGLEISNILPSIEEAKLRFTKHGISTGKMSFRSIKPIAWGRLRTLMFFQALFSGRKFHYPILRAYVDIFLINSAVMPKFCNYLGALSASDLFVESAVPTALILSSDKIKTISQTKLKRGDVWGKDIAKLGERHHFSVKNLIEQYPSDVLFYHPIKFSKWSLE